MSDLTSLALYIYVKIWLGLDPALIPSILYSGLDRSRYVKIWFFRKRVYCPILSIGNKGQYSLFLIELSGYLNLVVKIKITIKLN